MLRALSLVVALALTLTLVAPVAGASSVVKQKIKTWAWSVPSPDPTGLAFLPSGRLLVTDSEVEETSLAAGKNMWRISTTGTVLGTMSTLRFSKEPTDIAVDRFRKIWYFSDDSSFGGIRGKIFVRNLGPDGKYGTADDTRRSFSTAPFGSNDPEALAWGAGSLWIGDGSGRKVFRIRAGANGRIDGGGDDIITSFSVDQFGVHDVEGLEYGPNGNIFVLGNQPNADILEMTKTGELVRSIDLSGIPLRNPSALAYGPASRNPDNRNFYIADRGVDNNVDPSENDGRIFEIKVTAGPPNLISNGSFKRDRDADGHPDHWSENANFTRSTEVVHTLNYSGKHAPASEASYSVRQTVTNILPGETYRFTGFVNIPATADEFRFQLRIAWFGSNGAKLEANQIRSFTAATAGWVEATKDVTAPAGAVRAKVLMSATGLSATVYVDSFSLTAQ